MDEGTASSEAGGHAVLSTPGWGGAAGGVTDATDSGIDEPLHSESNHAMDKSNHATHSPGSRGQTLTALTPAAAIAAVRGGATAVETTTALHGFGGLHGGLALALAAARAGTDVVDRPLRSVSAQFLRPIRGRVDLEHAVVHRGRRLQVGAVTVQRDQATALRATVVHGSAFASTDGRSPQPPPAITSDPDDHAPFRPPPEFVPISTFVDIRPATTDLPYTGGPRPELTAWLRSTDTEEPIDVYRLILLMDALAPAEAAVLDVPVAIPTVELTVRPGRGLGTARSPWMLLHARTSGSVEDGWVVERLDAWSRDGSHLGSADQLRVIDG